MTVRLVPALKGTLCVQRLGFIVWVLISTIARSSMSGSFPKLVTLKIPGAIRVSILMNCEGASVHSCQNKLPSTQGPYFGGTDPIEPSSSVMARLSNGLEGPIYEVAANGDPQLGRGYAQPATTSIIWL